MKKKLEENISDISVTLNNNLSEDLVNIIKRHSATVKSENASHSFQQVVRDQQLQAATRDPRGTRWHPLKIRQCIKEIWHCVFVTCKIIHTLHLSTS